METFKENPASGRKIKVEDFFTEIPNYSYKKTKAPLRLFSIDNYLKYCTERRDLKITLSGKKKVGLGYFDAF